ncbi:MAG: TIGR01458 family HAD-type hydrolase [Bacteroidota bacterium]
MDWTKNIKGLLIDLDGVIYENDELIEGAAQKLIALRKAGIGIRFVTNTSTKPVDKIYEKLTSLGLEVEQSEIFSAVSATKAYLRTAGFRSFHFLVRDEVKAEIPPYPQEVDFTPEVVVVGDIGPMWDYALMNKLFQWMMNGANLVVMHKNRYWQTKDGLTLDIGAFITGLEYATGKTAKVIGKPETTFFETAINSLNLQKHEVAMIGDDIFSDIGGAQNTGIKSILVKTGKYRKDQVEQSGIEPDLVINAFKDLMIRSLNK